MCEKMQRLTGIVRPYWRPNSW